MLKNNQIKKELNLLIKEKKIDFWFLTNSNIKRRNFYFRSDFILESFLKSIREEFEVRVYKKIEKNKEFFFKTFTFGISSKDNIKSLKTKIRLALKLSENSLIKYFEIESRTNLKENKNMLTSYLEDLEKKENFEEVVFNKVKILEEKIKDHNSNSNVKIIQNSLEFFFNINKISLETNFGLKKSYKKVGVYLETILSAKNSENDFENIEYKHIENFEKFNFSKYFDEIIEIILDKVSSKKISKNFSGPIILSSNAAFDFFISDYSPNPMISHLSSKMKFLKMSNFVKNEILIKKVNCDKLDISIKAKSKNSFNIPFDEWGDSSKNITLVKNNTIKNFISSRQYGFYTKNKLTGPFGQVEINLGNLNFKNLVYDENNLIEILSFAWFNPDDISGDFSAEIRFGYIHKKGKKIPFYGGLFTGNVFEMLKNVKLSKDRIIEKGYSGPKYLKFLKGKIIA